MSYKLSIEPAAEDDILEAFYWYEERLEGLGSRYLEEVTAPPAKPGASEECEPLKAALRNRKRFLCAP